MNRTEQSPEGGIWLVQDEIAFLKLCLLILVLLFLKTTSSTSPAIKFPKKNGESLFKDHKEVTLNQAKGREYFNSFYSWNYWFRNSNDEQVSPPLIEDMVTNGLNPC